MSMMSIISYGFAPLMHFANTRILSPKKSCMWGAAVIVVVRRE